MNNQVTKEQLIGINESLVELLNYYKELRDILQENILVENNIYKSEMYNNMYNEINNLLEEVNEMINKIDYY